MRDDEGDEAGGVGVGVADEWEGVLDDHTAGAGASVPRRGVIIIEDIKSRFASRK